MEGEGGWVEECQVVMIKSSNTCNKIKYTRKYGGRHEGYSCLTVLKVFFSSFVPQFFLFNMLMFYVIVAGGSLHQL